MSGQVTVTLGDQEYVVVPQKIGYLMHRLNLGDVLEVQQGRSFGMEAHRLLSVVIPEVGRRLPAWEFLGYASREAHEAGEYDPEQDRSPTGDQIIAALETALRVNGGERLGKLLGPQMIQGLLQVGVSEMASRA